MKVGCDDTHQLLPRPLPALRGALDEVMLLHRPLSAEEVQRLARREKLPGINDDDALVLHLSFAGGKTRDRSGHNNHGRIAAESAAAVEGPVGEALALVQPKHVIAPPEGGRGTNIGYRWRRDVPLMVRAMALAGDVLLVAGPPDVLDEDAAFQDYPKQATQQRLAAQQAALNGAQGALLHAVDASNGQTLAEHTLDALPVFDGLSVAGGRAFIATTDGRVICMEPAK